MSTDNLLDPKEDVLVPLQSLQTPITLLYLAELCQGITCIPHMGKRKG